MLTPLVFIVGGIVWLLVLIVAVALCRAAAIGDEQAELAQVIQLDDYRWDWHAEVDGWDWPRGAA
jgi:hypothetical protein